jgi:hypothetical protein
MKKAYAFFAVCYLIIAVIEIENSKPWWQVALSVAAGLVMLYLARRKGQS